MEEFHSQTSVRSDRGGSDPPDAPPLWIRHCIDIEPLTT